MDRLGDVGEDRERECEVEALLERQPLGDEIAPRESRRHAEALAHVEDLLDGVAPEQRSRSDVPGEEPRQAPPTAAEVEHLESPSATAELRENSSFART